MSKKYPEKRPVPIFDSKNSPARMSKPMPMNTPHSTEPLLERPQLQQKDPPAEMSQSDGMLNTATLEPSPAQSEQAVVDSVLSERDASGISTSGDATDAVHKGNALMPAGEGKGSTGSKPKADIETLEQFVAYAFTRKGQRVTLKPKLERRIAENTRLDDAALQRLYELADADTSLAVLRQILLLSREIQGLPALRAALKGFVFDAMRRHPVFVEPATQASLRNLPDAPSAEDALKRVAEYEPASAEGKDIPKPAELQALRLNAVQLMATWLACDRGVNPEELSNLLFKAVWAPSARDLADDNARLRVLTEIAQSAGVGVACDKFRQRAVEATAGQDQAYREVSRLRAAEESLSSQVELAQAQCDALSAELQILKVSKAIEMAEARKLNEVERTHLRHAMEQLRGHLVLRLGESIEMLEVGLTALRNKTPRTEVMAERAEHVIDALRAEESKLRER